MPDRPEDPFRRLQRDVERLFHSLVYQRHPSTHFAEPVWAPPVDLLVSDRAARVIVELAGVPREGVQLRLQGNLLEIRGRREPPHKLEETHYHLAEINFGDFRRVVELPWNAEPDAVQAHYRDGMLEIHLKRTASDEPRDVTIEHHGSA